MSRRSALAACFALVLVPGAVWAQEGEPRRILVPLPSGFSSGPRTAALAAADYDGDGVPELAVLNTQAGLLKVLAVEEGAEPRELTTIAVGLSPTSINAEDIDGDGRLDALIGSNGSHQVTIAYGDGRGRFPDVREIPLPEAVRAQALGDFTGDGLLDIVAVGGGNGAVLVLPAVGGRAFGEAIPLVAPLRFPHVVVAGDFNGDGVEDFAVWGRDPGIPRLAVFESRGAGRFSAPLSPSPPLPDPGPLVPVQGAVAGDFDGDGADELLLFTEAVGTLFAVWKTPPGFYASSPVGPALGVPASLQAADMDADGRLDAAVLVGGALGGVSVLRGLAGKPPAFEESCVVFPQSGSSLLVTLEFNRDGIADLLMVQPPEERAEIIVTPLAQCAGPDDCRGGPASRCHEVEGPYRAPRPERLAIADFEGDERAEILVLGDGRGRLFAREGIDLPELWAAPVPAVVDGLAVGDMDGNGRLDFVCSDLAAGTFLVFLQGLAGFPPFPSRVLEAGVLTSGVAVQDFDGDGHLDVAGSLVAENRVSIFLGAGAGDFLRPFTVGAGRRPGQLAAGDVDGDRIPDLVVANNGEATVSLLRGRGDGSFIDAVPLPAIATVEHLALGDVDADGRSDVAVASSAERSLALIDSVGGVPRTRTFDLPSALSAATDVRLDDLDGDGLDDIVAADAVLHAAVVFWSLGGGALHPPVTVPVCRSEARGEPLAAAAGDVDGDGSEDLVVADQGSSFVHLFRSIACSRPVLFRRGDVNFDLRVNLTDAVLSLNVLFIGAERFPCADAADVNDSGGINLTDALHLLNYSFLGGPPPPAPGPRSCGVDPTNDVLGECEAACR